MITAARRVQFCAGHRVYGHEGKCRNLHGHNYVAFFTAEAPLDSVGRVIDFGVLKEKLGGWIDENWDHGFILYGRDSEAIEAVERVTPHKLYTLPWNPTAENMALYLLHEVAPKVLAGTGVRVIEVVVWETENCHAVAKLSVTSPPLPPVSTMFGC